MFIEGIENLSNLEFQQVIFSLLLRVAVLEDKIIHEMKDSYSFKSGAVVIIQMRRNLDGQFFLKKVRQNFGFVRVNFVQISCIENFISISESFSHQRKELVFYHIVYSSRKFLSYLLPFVSDLAKNPEESEVLSRGELSTLQRRIQIIHISVFALLGCFLIRSSHHSIWYSFPINIACPKTRFH